MDYRFRTSTPQFDLSQEPLLFCDWAPVYSGYPGWVMADGKDVAENETDGQGEGGAGKQPPVFSRQVTPVADDRVRATALDVPFGVRLRAQPATKRGPWFERTEPWETRLGFSTVIHVDGTYKLWCNVKCPPENRRYMFYAESDDGFTWRKPMKGSEPWHERQRTNIVFGPSTYGSKGYGSGGVMLDTAAPQSERYKMIFSGSLPADEFARYVQRTGKPFNTHWSGCVIFGATSPDGIAWKILDEPLLPHYSDTHTIVNFDRATQRYVGYFRVLHFGRRCIGRSETPDFTDWPPVEIVLAPGAHEDPADGFYTNGYVQYPGATNTHFMFSAIWSRAIDTTRVRVATSRDGVVWSWVPGEPVLSAQVGEWDYGCIFPGHTLVPLGDDQLGLSYVGYHVPHKFPRMLDGRPVIMGDLGYACWRRDRIVALEARQRGGFTTIPLRLHGDGIVLNTLTERAGEVRAEVLDGTRPEAIPGRTLEESDPICGDHLAKRLTWNGDGHLSDLKGETIRLRIRMRAAKLFSLRAV